MKHHSRRASKYLAAVSASLIAFGLIGCSSANQPQENTQSPDASEVDLSGVTIVFGQQGQQNSPYFEASGAFEDTPYTIEFASFNNPGDNLTANASGSVDVSYVGEWSGLQAASATAPWSDEDALYKSILVLEQGNPEEFDAARAVVTASSGLESLEESKGKRWGYIPGSYFELLTNQALAALGWSADDVQLTPLNVTELRTAVETGEVDVAFVYTSYYLDLIDSGTIRTVATSHADFDLPFNNALWASTGSLNDPAKSLAIEDFIRRFIEAEKWFVSNPDEAQRVGIEANLNAPERAKGVWEYDRRKSAPITQRTIDGTQKLLDLGNSIGLIDNSTDAAVFYDDRYTDAINEALQSLGFDQALSDSYR